MTTAWSHLPNAAHIDAVIASDAEYPDQWAAVREAAWNASWVKAWDTAWLAARESISMAELSAYDAAWANGAVLALIAYDDCAYLLSMPADRVRVLAGLGLPAAVLLLPAVVAFESIKELSYE